MPIPNRPNVRWSLDFVSDTFGASRKFRVLAVNDDCTRENLGLIADTSLSGARVARELTAMIRIYGKPDCIVSEPPCCAVAIVSRPMARQWQLRATMAAAPSSPAPRSSKGQAIPAWPGITSTPANRSIEPWSAIGSRTMARGLIESFNGSLRDECLNEEIFDSLADARQKLALWRYDYNQVRPHSSLGNKTPAEARRALEQSDGTAPGVLAQPETDAYQQARLSS